MRTLTGIVSAIAITGSMLSAPASALTLGTAEYNDPTPTGPSAATEGAMQFECTTLAGNHGPRWTGTLSDWDEGAVVPGSESPAGDAVQVGPAVGIGPIIPEQVQVSTLPFRVGGSPNMFGMATVVAAHYSDSEYDVSREFTWQAEYNFTCAMTEEVDTPALGVHQYIGGGSDSAKESCEGDRNPKPAGVNRGPQCPWVQTVPAGTEIEDRDDEFGSIIQNEGPEPLDGREYSGGPIPVDDELEDISPVQVVVCISPANPSGGKKGAPGEWRSRNGYSGGSPMSGQPGCNTGWYDTGAIAASPHDNVHSNGNNIVTIPTT